MTARLPNDALQTALEALTSDWQAAGIEAVTPIGDCHAPGLIVHAVYAGHRYARELDGAGSKVKFVFDGAHRSHPRRKVRGGGTGETMATDESAAQDHSYDAIVVGSGISGGWAAKELTEKGLKTLVLERGRMVEHSRTTPPPPSDPWDLPYGNRHRRRTSHRTSRCRRAPAIPHASNQHWFVDDLDHPYIEEQAVRLVARLSRRRPLAACGRARAIASSPTRLRGQRARRASAFHWPIRYDEIAPWYDQVETFAGISGSVEGLPQLPDGKFLPPMRSQLRRESISRQRSRSKLEPQAHHRPRRATSPRRSRTTESAARHLPVAQHVHSRLSVRRLLQQRLGDAAVGAKRTGNMTLGPTRSSTS